MVDWGAFRCIKSGVDEVPKFRSDMVLAVGNCKPLSFATSVQPSESDGPLSLLVRIPLLSCRLWAKSNHQGPSDVAPLSFAPDLELSAFFKLLEDEVIQQFLHSDRCAKIADKYLLAMVYVYFRRANLTLDQYTRVNFFAALFLANDMEEDKQHDKYQILLWSTQHQQTFSVYPKLLVQRDTLWRKMDYRAYVRMEVCEKVFALSPDHPVWKRERLPHHGGAQRIHPDMQVVVRYSQAFSQTCEQCETAGAQGNSRWCSSGTVYHSSSTFLPHQPRCRRPSISAPLYKKRKIKTDQEEQPPLIIN